MLIFRYFAPVLLVLSAAAYGQPGDAFIVSGIAGRSGGTLVFAQRNEPKSLNPAVAADSASREVMHRINADLIHINRETQLTEPALAKSWTVSSDGLHYVLNLRKGVRFSDGHSFDADDVVFSFRVYLDEKVLSPQRDLLLLEGKPIAVRKLDAYRVAFDLPGPYAAAERLFDGFVILPRHILERPYLDGKLAEAWGVRSPADQVVGLGPFRLKQFVPGQRVVLERNPYYWKLDKEGTRLPYLSEVDFVFAGSEDMQVMRFQTGESDVISRPSARNFAVLQKEGERRGYTLKDAGPGLEYSVLFFNLNDSPAAGNAPFHRESFRRAVSLAIDRDAIVRLVYQGRAAALSTPVPPGDKAWVNDKLPRIVRSIPQAKQLLSADGFSWAPGGSLLDPAGKPVEFSIVTSAGNSERVQMATLIADDLKPLGIAVHVTPLDFASLLNRVFQTHDYEACLLSLSEADADPNTDMAVLLSSAGNHLWQPEQKTPATPWEAEIDGLMRRQMVTRNRVQRKQLFDRVQAIVMDKLPMIPLVSPYILVGARNDLGNFRPALLDHYALWNIEELYWRGGRD
ncbi:MAG: ABC transporter substrate-binding protein [Candidatus Sulfopaludibacter sp.]|nr:ABC transporter substrate-binding protein [Candidatus Sulfopaludibacter sp.]